ncbi:hypothetical protein BTR14_12750 [Rhizobium rhizosphaerae]|uniref:histidine kinase n=2 Tax=Xaviernesmea rhizosphaerae TaxID=1672749 RepID=A0ABX3PBZ5_9HYPH|nr:hypothetical protein BTR14_12750 [Xaviernesmea rhizosphaerae]
MLDDAAPRARDSSMILDLVANGLGLAVLVWDRDDRLLFAARAVLGLFPISPSFLEPGTRLRDYLGALYDAGLGSGIPVEGNRRRVGREEWISNRLSLHWRERFESVERMARRSWISTSNRRLSNGIGIVLLSDLTQQKLHEEELQQDRERVELTERILDELPNAVCVKDRNLNYVAVNKAFCDMHGMSASALLGRSVWDLVDAEFAERYENSDRDVLENGTRHVAPQQIVTADGEDLWTIVHKFRVGKPADGLLVTYFSDVTPLIDGFGPLGMEGSGAALVPRGAIDRFEPAQNLYDPFKALDVSSLVETPAIQLPVEVAYRLRILLVTSCPTLERRFADALAELSCDVGIVNSFAMLKDLNEALAGIALSPNLILYDESLGAPPPGPFDALPHLPVSLHLAPRDLAAQIMAAGLSSQEVVGDIHAQAAGLAPVAQPQTAIDVLVAEDNDINQIVFAQILEGLGLSFKIAVNGEEAVAFWRSHHPKLILMDLAMPVMDGHAAIRTIRASEEQEAQEPTPIVIVTTQAADMEAAEMAALAVPARLMKPVSPERVEALFHRFAAGQPAAERIAP